MKVQSLTQKVTIWVDREGDLCGSMAGEAMVRKPSYTTEARARMA